MYLKRVQIIVPNVTILPDSVWVFFFKLKVFLINHPDKRVLRSDYKPDKNFPNQNINITTFAHPLNPTHSGSSF